MSGIPSPGSVSVVSVHAHMDCFLSVSVILAPFTSFNLSLLSRLVSCTKSPSLSCFCKERLECVPRGLRLYGRPVALIDFTFSHFLSRCHSLSHPLSHLLSITRTSVCSPLATGAECLFFFIYSDGKHVHVDFFFHFSKLSSHF